MKKTNDILYNSSLFLLPFSLFIGLGITKIVNTAKSDMWISIIIGTIFGLGINYIIKILPKKNSKVALYISNFVLLLLGITTITKLISSVYLDETSSIIIIIPFMLLILYSALKNRYALMKVISILNIIYFFLFVFAALSLMPTINIDYFKPVAINSPSSILLGSLEYALYSTAPLIALPNFKEKYNYKTYLLSSLFILFIFIVVIGNLGIELSISYRYPEYMVFKNIAILDFIENIENVLFFIWIINIYTLTSHITINIREITNIKGLIITLLLEFIIISLFLLNNYKVPIVFLKYLDYIVLGVLLVFIIGKLIGKEKTHTN